MNKVANLSKQERRELFSETAYLLNNRANRLHLEESIAQMEAGQASERELIEEK